MAGTPKYINEVLERLVRIEALEENTAGKVEEIHKCVFGDGNPEEGLIYKVKANEDFLINIKRFLWLAIGAFVAGLGGLMFSIFA